MNREFLGFRRMSLLYVFGRVKRMAGTSPGMVTQFGVRLGVEAPLPKRQAKCGWNIPVNAALEDDEWEEIEIEDLAVADPLGSSRLDADVQEMDVVENFADVDHMLRDSFSCFSESQSLRREIFRLKEQVTKLKSDYDCVDYRRAAATSETGVKTSSKAGKFLCAAEKPQAESWGEQFSAAGAAFEPHNTDPLR
ncbi:hypothetical protein RP20_CCG013305 [Aedes albopictus]|nr:hypothetical protein RP20_CCG013305 [Aedes albopictus]